MPSEKTGKQKCPDCFQCQGCSEDRCRLCRKEGHPPVPATLATGFTFGEYLDWKDRRKDRCTACRSST